MKGPRSFMLAVTDNAVLLPRKLRDQPLAGVDTELRSPRPAYLVRIDGRLGRNGKQHL